jgi:hypothetical protein
MTQSDVLGADELILQAEGLMQIAPVNAEDTQLLTDVINTPTNGGTDGESEGGERDSDSKLDWKQVAIYTAAGLGGILVLAVLIKLTCCQSSSRSEVRRVSRDSSK